MVFGFARIFSGLPDAIRSTASRKIRVGFSAFSQALITARSVIEFLEKSPSIILKSASFTADFSSSDSASEPDSVEGRNLKLDSGGRDFESVSGKTLVTSFTGVLLSDSAILISVLND